MKNWKDVLFDLTTKRDNIVKGVLPYLEPNSLKEELVFNELAHLNNQIRTILLYIKDEVNC